MIERYSRPEMTAIWHQQTKFKIWFEIEAHACDAMAQLNLIPKAAAKKIRSKGSKIKFDAKKIAEIEKQTKHDVIAFLTFISQKIGSDARYIHQGMTSSDILDTCLNVQLQRASAILLRDLDSLLAVLKKRALQHKYTLMMGRSHGIHGEPITFGLKLATFYAEFLRCKKRLQNASLEISTCAISGAMGTFAHIHPAIEKHVAKKMGLQVEPISTQIIPRDRHAAFFSTLGIIASSVERLAVEIRHLQRTELQEAQEYFSSKQKGSSAMPHKRNPILSENLTGLARMVRSYVLPAMENVATWHERDISHSSVERMIAPDATITLDFALARLTDIVKNLLVNKKQMQKNIDSLYGLHQSQRVLLALTQKGLSREVAYKLVQQNAMLAWDKGMDFFATLSQDAKIKNTLSKKELAKLFDNDFHTKHVDKIFKRVFK